MTKLSLNFLFYDLPFYLSLGTEDEFENIMNY